jgi:hypothetical protein
MTSTKKIGGHEWMQVSGWPKMTSYDSKILLTQTKSTRRALGIYTKTRCFPFNDGFVLILMKFFISKMQVRWMGFMYFSPWGFRHLRNLRPYSNLVTMGLFLWMPHFGPMMWSTIYSHWWRLISLHRGANCLDYHKSKNMWRFGGMVECPTCKVFFAYARLETIMFHCGWCPTITPNIVVGCSLISYFLLHCLMFWYYISMGIP